MFDDAVPELFPPTKPKRDNTFLKAKKAMNKLFVTDSLPPVGNIYPSRVGWLCAREHVFKKFLPRPYPSDDFASLMRMDTGTALHTHLQNEVLGPAQLIKGYWRDFDKEEVSGYQPKTGQWFYVETRARAPESVSTDSLFSSGKVDGFIGESRYQWLLGGMKGDPPKDDNSKDRIWEFKFTSDRNYGKIKTWTDISEGYLMQAELYQHWTGIDNTIFLFFNFSDWNYKFIPFEFTGKYLKMAQEKVEQVYNGLQDGELPEMFACDHEKSSRAKKCPYSKECFSKKKLYEILDENSS